jgi:hypothetical protein
VFTIVGIIYLLQQSFLFASTALAISSVAGLISAFDKAYHHKKGRLDEIIKNL